MLLRALDQLSLPAAAEANWVPTKLPNSVSQGLHSNLMGTLLAYVENWALMLPLKCGTGAENADTVAPGQRGREQAAASTSWSGRALVDCQPALGSIDEGGE